MNIASSTTIQPSDPSGYAVCTLVMKELHYAVGATVLAHSIRQHNVAASLVCLLTTDLVDPASIPACLRECPNLYLADNYHSESDTPASFNGAGTPSCTQESLTALKLLLNVFHHVVLVSPIAFPVQFRASQQTKGYHGWLPRCFSKLHIFRLTAFTKVLFLDADMLCLGDFSDIFALDTPFGTLTDDNLLFTHGKTVSRKTLLNSLKTRYGISAACFCITPSLLEFDRAMGRLRQRCADAKELVYFETFKSIRVGSDLSGGTELNAGPDEQLLGWMYFHGRTDDLTAWTTISCMYNCQSFRVTRDVPQHLRAGVRIIHYVTDKPWDKCGRNGKIWPDMKIWFDQLESLIAATARAGLGGVMHMPMGVGIGLDADDRRVLSSLREGNKFMTQGEADEEWTASNQPRPPVKYQAPGGYRRYH